MAPPRYSDVETQARQAAIAALKAGGSPADAARAAIDAAEAFLPMVIAAVGLQEQMAAIQCGAGCYQCCHQLVGVTVAELELVKSAVDTLPEPVRSATRARIADMAQRGSGLDQAGWWQAKLRCPLLDDEGRCQVHAARPLPCRAMNSSNAETCRRSFAGERLQIPILAAQHRSYGHAQLGLAQALAECKRDTTVVNLALGLS
ncbi:MAG TPA: YkgJ family cysteine cluster protein [Magnetospirillum sp.]|jgi:Fe-S-cluster containining protein|nr:YkgJ family cysteine cluster protein [Magnetospirillum sp.]